MIKRHMNVKIPHTLKLLIKPLMKSSKKRYGTGLATEYMESLKGQRESAVIFLSSVAGAICGQPVEPKEFQIIKFSSVEKHLDEWPQTTHNGIWCAPEFMHIVVSGKCIIHDHDGAQTFTAGDVFTMNPNATHWTTNKRDCVTLVATIPRKLIKN